MPVAFAGPAPVGAVLEMAVIRRLALRPPDTGDLGRQPHPATGRRPVIVAVAALGTL